MLEQNDTHLTTWQLSLPDKERWLIHWWGHGQRWRTEPEIDAERQKYLGEQRSKYDFMNYRTPFKDIELNRADVEWLLATHENDRGPVDWSDLGQRKREGVNLHGAILLGVDLWMLPLAKTNLYSAHLEGANLHSAHLEGANLAEAHLEGASLISARLENALLLDAHLERASLGGAHLEGAMLGNAHLEGASLYMTFLDAMTVLNRIVLSNKEIGPIAVLDVHWGDANVAVVDWSSLSVLGDERIAHQLKNNDGTSKSNAELLYGYESATRAYRQLSVMLRNQGFNEDASRFTYRAQLIQRKVFWYRRKFIKWLGSLFLDLLSGYGYKVVRCFIAYVLVIGVFATIYYLLGTHTAWNESIVISMTAFHGRGFFPEQFHPGDPQALAAAIEAFVGLLIEITLIATLTQRFFGK